MALVCAKCQTRLTPSVDNAKKSSHSLGSIPPLPGMRLDSTRMQATLSRVDRLVQRLGEPVDFDPPPARGTNRPPAPQTEPLDPVEAFRADNRFPWLATLSLAGGVMLLVCGCFLIVWSIASRRPELFNVGFPVAVISLGCMALAACLYFQDASGKQAETQKWLADVQNQLGGIRQLASDSRHSIGSIPELPTTPTCPANQSLAQSEERIKEIRRRLNETRSS